MKKTNQPIDIDWKDALDSIKTDIIKKEEAKKAHHKEMENALRPYFKQAAYHLKISHQQLMADIKLIEPKLKKVLADRRLKAGTYAKLIKKYNPEYYYLFEAKIKSAVKAEQKYFQEKRQAELKFGNAPQLEAAAQVKAKRKLTKYEKRASKRKQYNEKPITAQVTNTFSRPVFTPISQWIDVEWHDVIFDDYLIKVKYGTNYSRSYPLSESRKSFNFLRKYIKRLNLPALSIFLVGNEIQEIKNAERVKEMVTLLRIKEQMIEDFQQNKPIAALSVMERIKPVSKQFLIQIAIAGNGEIMCIEYLASLLATGFKPIPAFEIIPSGNSINTEDTFIFVIERQSKLYLVWESTVHGRATYIFKTDFDSYLEVVQAIYDYIGSPRKAKRMSLRKRNSDTLNLGYDGYVTHSAFDHWRQKLEECFNQD